MTILHGPKALTLHHVAQEVAGARAKFPENQFKLAAMLEEAGEVAKALMELARGKPGVTPADVYAECIQLGAMALRLAEEGSAEFSYRYSPATAGEFCPTGAQSHGGEDESNC